MRDAAPPPRELKWTARLHRLNTYLPSRGRFVGGMTQGLMSAAAAIVAYLPTEPLGLQEGFWGSITAIAVVQSELGATQSSARDQFAGAAIGGLIGAVVVTLAGQRLPAYALAVMVSMTVCWLFNVASAARLDGHHHLSGSTSEVDGVDDGVPHSRGGLGGGRWCRHGVAGQSRQSVERIAYDGAEPRRRR
jgi:hypothetical protein